MLSSLLIFLLVCSSQILCSLDPAHVKKPSVFSPPCEAGEEGLQQAKLQRSSDEDVRFVSLQPNSSPDSSLGFSPEGKKGGPDSVPTIPHKENLLEPETTFKEGLPHSEAPNEERPWRFYHIFPNFWQKIKSAASGLYYKVHYKIQSLFDKAASVERKPNITPTSKERWANDIFGPLYQNLRDSSPTEYEEKLDEIAQKVAETTRSHPFRGATEHLQKSFESTPALGQSGLKTAQKEHVRKATRDLLSRAMEILKEEEETWPAVRKLNDIHDSLTRLMAKPTVRAVKALDASSSSLTKWQLELYRGTKRIIKHDRTLFNCEYLADFLIIFGPGGVIRPNDEASLKQLSQEWGLKLDVSKVEMLARHYPQVREQITHLLEEYDAQYIAWRYGNGIDDSLSQKATGAKKKLKTISQELEDALRPSKLDVKEVFTHIAESDLTRSLFGERKVGTDRESELLPFVEPFGLAKTIEYVESKDMDKYVHGMASNIHNLGLLMQYGEELEEPLKERYAYAMRLRHFRRSKCERYFNSWGLKRIQAKIRETFPSKNNEFPEYFSDDES